jgi:glycosidase
MRTPARLTLAALAILCNAAPPSLSCQTTASTATRVPPAWTKRSVIYEINVRQYTPEGTFAALQRHLPRLKQLDVDILWVMPVQPIGKKNRKGPLGSYYSISDYTAINPEYGNQADFRAFVDAAHRQGMKVVLDWVANHTAFDHRWITAHPDWYVHRPDGTISYARDNEGRETDWTDVAELNYDNPAMRRAMIGDMKWWMDSMRVDGFRCDVAGGVPMDFWVDARRRLARAHPGLFMLAEAEGPEYYAAFDMTYGWELHHLLNELAQGKKPATELDKYVAAQQARYPRDAYHMDFTSDHDENSWNGSEFERMGVNHVPAFVLAATLQGSMPLLYTGQEASMRKRLRFFDKDTVDWSGPSLAGFYRSMFDLKHENPALWNGAYGGAQSSVKTNGGDRVYAFTRSEGANTVFVAVNFGSAPATVTYTGLQHPGRFTDWFNGSASSLAATGQLAIPANGYRVLVAGAERLPRAGESSNR